MSNNLVKAFNYEQGQYICHVYASIPEDDRYSLESLVKNIHSKPRLEQTCAEWQPVHQGNSTNCDEKDPEDDKLHVTLLRGHRAIHYHQIRYMIDKFRSECEVLQPARLLLDRLTIFCNAEETKQFLCLASTKFTSAIESSTQTNPLFELKRTIKSTVNQYATQLTNEDETEDTIAHCSLMSREYVGGRREESELSREIAQIIDIDSDEYPSCLLNIEAIYVKVGKKIYKVSLGKLK